MASGIWGSHPGKSLNCEWRADRLSGFDADGLVTFWEAGCGRIRWGRTSRSILRLALGRFYLRAFIGLSSLPSWQGHKVPRTARSRGLVLLLWTSSPGFDITISIVDGEVVSKARRPQGSLTIEERYREWEQFQRILCSTSVLHSRYARCRKASELRDMFELLIWALVFARELMRVSAFVRELMQTVRCPTPGYLANKLQGIS